MGHTKTVCCNTGLVHLFAKEWTDLVQQRRGLTQALRSYLQTDSCVEGVPHEVRGLNRHLDLLADAYVALVKEELSGHDSARTSMRCMRATALVFSDMWRLPAALQSEHFQGDHALEIGNSTASPAANVAFLEKLVEEYSGVSPDSPTATEVVDSARVLSEAYVKACAEYEAVLQQPEVSVVKHHASLISDIVKQMLALLRKRSTNPILFSC